MSAESLERAQCGGMYVVEKKNRNRSKGAARSVILPRFQSFQAVEMLTVDEPNISKVQVPCLISCLIPHFERVESFLSISWRRKK
jgi:hypothetical protein